LPFSLHLLYAIVDSIRDDAQGGREAPREPGIEDETTLLNAGDVSNNIVEEESEEHDERRGETVLENELIWPPRRILWPNWILQITNLFLLCILRIVGYPESFHPSHIPYAVFLESPLSLGSLQNWHVSSWNIVAT
jgi:hypothetical protein